MKGENLKTTTRTVLLVTLALGALTGCGGGGSGESEERTYTLGGTVTGLDGRLELLNGAEALSVTADGAFSFIGVLADGAGYAVTIEQRPSFQNCSITNASGTIAGADVTDIAVACADKAWNHPADLTDIVGPDSGIADLSPQSLAVGSAVLVWSENVSNTILVSTRDAAGWQHPTDLAKGVDLGGQPSADTAASIDGNGNRLVAWSERAGSPNPYRIYVREYRNGVWSLLQAFNETLIANNVISPTLGGSQPSIVMDDNGNAVVAWTQANYVFASHYRDGSWTHPATAADALSAQCTTTNITRPMLGMSASGEARVAWGCDGEVFVDTYSAGAWQGAVIVNQHTAQTDGDFYPRLAMNAQGETVVAWLGTNGAGETQLYASEYRNGAWRIPGAEEHVSPAGAEVLAEQETFVADIGAAGDTLLAWVQQDGTNFRVYKAHYTNGQWSIPSDLSDAESDAGVNAFSPSVALNASDYAMVLWRQANRVHISEWRNTLWSAPRELVALGVDGNPVAQIISALDDDGNGYLCWAQRIDTIDEEIRVFLSELR